MISWHSGLESREILFICIYAVCAKQTGLMNKCFSFPAGVVQISRWGNIQSANVDTERMPYELILLLVIADFNMLGQDFAVC